jgi:hypothetical protein
MLSRNFSKSAASTGKEPAEDHRLHLLEAGQRLGGGAAGVGDGIADAGLGDLLDLGGDEADLARLERIQRLDLGAEGADPVDQMGGAGGHEPDLLALADRPVDHADQDDDSEIGVVPAVDQHRFEGRAAVAFGRRDPSHDRLQHLVDADAGLGRGEDGVVRRQPDYVLDLLPDLVRVGGGEVDLVDDGHDLVVVLDRLVDVGQRLSLDPLGGVDHQKRALTGGEAAADLVGEVDVAGRVHEVEDVGIAVAGFVVEPHRLRLDRDPALLLDVHRIEHLPAHHLPVGQPPGPLDQPVGERAFAMIYMRNNGEIADSAELGHFAAGVSSRGVGRQSEAKRPAAAPTSSDRPPEWAAALAVAAAAGVGPGRAGGSSRSTRG